VAGKLTLREKRLEAALSMNELATAAKVSASTVMDIERGASPRMATIRKLAKALGCAPQDIAWPGDPFSELGAPDQNDT
jgi:transcriptional regulator with XRE-family HTH domain